MDGEDEEDNEPFLAWRCCCAAPRGLQDVLTWRRVAGGGEGQQGRLKGSVGNVENDGEQCPDMDMRISHRIR